MPISSSTGETPNNAVFGNEREMDEKNEPHQNRMKTIHEAIKNELEWTKTIQKRYYDKKRVEAPSLKEGDKVYLRRRNKGKTNFNLKTKRTSTKLDYLKLGPFTIKRKLDYDNYELSLPTRMRIHPVFHISMLNKTSNPVTSKNEPIDDAEYEVERILKKRTRQGKVEYLVKWLGYENCDNSWEPITNLYCPVPIQEFEHRQHQKEKKQLKLGRKARRKSEYLHAEQADYAQAGTSQEVYDLTSRDKNSFVRQ